MSLRKVENLTQLKKIAEWPGLDEDIRIFLAKAYKDKPFLKYKTDGISWISELGFDKPGHPMGVGHDWIGYNRAMTMKASDEWFKRGLTQFGFPNYAKLYYIGLRTFGVPYRLAGRALEWTRNIFLKKKSGS